MKPVLVVCCLLGGLVAGAGQPQAATDCAPTLPEASVDGVAAPGRPFLGQGIALFDAHNLKMAERALQSALFAGLPDPQERALAHKYLAFVWCSNSEWVRCEAAFDAAFAARTRFSLEPYEIAGTPWREAYLRAQDKWVKRCADVTRHADQTQRAAGATAPTPAFALHSTVVVGIVALVPLASARGSTLPLAALPFEPDALRAGNNLKLRVSPWAYVQIDGKRVGVTPSLTQMKLSPGAHTVELINPGFETVRQVVRLTQDQPVLITHDFDAR